MSGEDGVYIPVGAQRGLGEGPDSTGVLFLARCWPRRVAPSYLSALAESLPLVFRRVCFRSAALAAGLRAPDARDAGVDAACPPEAQGVDDDRGHRPHAAQLQLLRGFAGRGREERGGEKAVLSVLLACLICL